MSTDNYSKIITPDSIRNNLHNTEDDGDEDEMVEIEVEVVGGSCGQSDEDSTYDTRVGNSCIEVCYQNY